MVNLSKDRKFAYTIKLPDISAVRDFVEIVSSKECAVNLIDSGGFRVNAKSVISTVLAAGKGAVWCVAGEDIYEDIRQFCVA